MNDRMPTTGPSEFAERALVDAILDGRFPPGTNLPGERTLAVDLGVARPPLREAIQRLARDGWLTVAHGKPTIVNDFWTEGGLNVLGKLVEHRSTDLPPGFVSQLLEVRLQLAPAYTKGAVLRAAVQVAAILSDSVQADDTPTAFARYDWRLHHALTVLCGNPIYTLILNGFRGFYQEVGRDYFSSARARELSMAFYRELRVAAERTDADVAEVICRRVMLTALELWQSDRGRDEGGSD